MTKKAAFAAILPGLGFLLLLAGRAASVEIAGSVVDARNHPVSPAQVSVTDQAGNIIGQADTDPDGHYSIDKIASDGTYSLTLKTPGTKYQGGTVETGMPREGLCVLWMVSEGASALAIGRPGAISGICTMVSAATAGTRSGTAPTRP
jgi:hypothetical protein